MNKVKILIRFDDICPTMNFDEFKKATDLMDKYGIKPLIGVIPDCQDPDLNISTPHIDFWNYIKQLQSKGYTVAMHGYNHVFDSKHHGIVDNRMESEFAGHCYDVQYEKIKKGKELLSSHGIDTDIFFAPAHSYDVNTIKALAKLGFKYISDGKSSKPYLRYGIKLLPCRSGGCPKIESGGMYTAVFHAHEWVRGDKMYCYHDFIRLLEEHKNDIIPFSEYSSVEPSSTFVQLLNEKLYVFYTYSIRPHLAKIYQQLK